MATYQKLWLVIASLEIQTHVKTSLLEGTLKTVPFLFFAQNKGESKIKGGITRCSKKY